MRVICVKLRSASSKIFFSFLWTRPSFFCLISRSEFHDFNGCEIHWKRSTHLSKLPFFSSTPSPISINFLSGWLIPCGLFITNFWGWSFLLLMMIFLTSDDDLSTSDDDLSYFWWWSFYFWWWSFLIVMMIIYFLWIHLISGFDLFGFVNATRLLNQIYDRKSLEMVRTTQSSI